MKYDRSIDSARNEVHRSAVTAVTGALHEHSRANTIMACGTGKTMVELGVAESLLAGRTGPKRILMQVPTLELIRQARDEWNEQQEFGDSYESICVCSDQQLKSESKGDEDSSEDVFRLDSEELSAQEINRIINWLDAREEADPNAVSVIFTTYQSVKIVGMAMGATDREFDFGVFDEAHKTAGHAGKADTFGYALDDANIKIKKRGFFTATPRVRTQRRSRSKSAGNEALQRERNDEATQFLSMDDEMVYGPQAYSISFREAAQKEIIVPYKVIVSIINDDNLSKEHLDTVVHDSHNMEVDARTVANMAALERAMNEYGLKKAITFHSTIAAAQDFANVRHSIEGATLSGFNRLHVSGVQSSSERKASMEAYAKKGVKSIISNAKCLTEGVNVPDTDLVAFMESKNSKVDITQAVGRAVRNAPGKEFGYVFLPLHVTVRKGESYEQAFDRSIEDFDQISSVLKALSDSDEALKDYLRNFSHQKSSKAKNRANDEDKQEARNFLASLPIEFLSDSYPGEINPDALVESIETKLISMSTDRLAFSWTERLHELQRFLAANGGKYPAIHSRNEDESKLASWVYSQRQGRNLTDERRAALESMGFDWGLDREDKWRQNFLKYKEFVAKNGGRQPSQNTGTEEEKRIAKWASNQRNDTELTAERKDALNSIDFVWKVDINAQWMKIFNDFKAYVNSHGGDYPSQHGNDSDEQFLGRWVSTQRKGTGLNDERLRLLDEFGFVWKVDMGPMWMENFEKLKSFLEQSGGNYPQQSSKKPGESKLGTWVKNQRTQKELIDGKRRELLESINFNWGTDKQALDKKWMSTLNDFTVFLSKSGGKYPVSDSKDPAEARLGRWVSQQRINRGMTDERRNLLDKAGFIWRIDLDARWGQMFDRLKEYVLENGGAYPSRCSSDIEVARIARWVTSQRSEKAMSDERRRALDEFGFAWSADQESEVAPFSMQHMAQEVYRERLSA
jgi:superfamily II DNA or RNA helicase